MDVDTFIRRWSNLEGGAERANYAMFLTELCGILDVPPPDPAQATTNRNDYVFERFVSKADGTHGRIDLYRRGAFVLEAKQSRQIVGGEKYVEGAQEQLTLIPNLLPADVPSLEKKPSRRRGWDVLMVNARRQAEDYARELPQDHGWPPFVLVCDVGNCIEVYSDFRKMGKYEQFPDRQHHRILMEDLRRSEVRTMLRAVWLEPHSLDPAKRSARATREIARRLAEVSKSLEADHPAEEVAHFLMRCLFTMFAEDVGLLPKACFQELLVACLDTPENFPPLLADLWQAMDGGGFAPSIRTAVKRFNGALFKQASVLPLKREAIGELLAAARQDWRDVEPAIFGTLLEQALDPKERQRLGAHYTPRAHVERLVTATVIEPLREEWAVVLATVEARRAANDLAGAVTVAKAFHTKLCSTRVLDPACGTGNFLYVSLDLMKRLEADVLEVLDSLGSREQGLSWLAGQTVDPHQFLGLELNPRAAAIAELVLWIGFLQLHYRTSNQQPAEPILQAFGNINFGRAGGYDAVLAWDAPAHGSEEAVALRNPRQPPWPAAEFIVGNPPFLGKGAAMRGPLGDRYVEALFSAHPQMDESADFVMYWWDRAAALLTQKGSVLRRFGFVTTNSITQEFSRRTIKRWLGSKIPLSLVFAIPDHPWTKATRDAAAVRIAMTVCQRGKHQGTLRKVVSEVGVESDEPQITLSETRGTINAGLSIGAHPALCAKLKSNLYLTSMGPALGGRGFVLSARETSYFVERSPSDASAIRKFVSGTEIIDGDRGRSLICLRDIRTEHDLMDRHPHLYQHLKETVYPGRRTNRDPKLRDEWWRFRRNNDEYFAAVAGLSRYIATVETAKHRFFTFVPADAIIEHGVVGIGTDSAAHLGVLSSKPHLIWARAAGGTLEDRPRYNKVVCFEPFPFPVLSDPLAKRLADAAERLDHHRKAQQAAHPGLSVTDMYNVRDAVRANRPLSARENEIKEKALVWVLDGLHDEIDRLVLEAYGWPAETTDDDILERLVSLNAERVAEERRGTVRWLRAAYQQGRAGVTSIAPEQTKVDLHETVSEGKPRFPREPLEQSAAVAAILAAATGPVDVSTVANEYHRDKRVNAKIEEILAAFVRTGFAMTTDGGRTVRARRVA